MQSNIINNFIASKFAKILGEAVFSSFCWVVFHLFTFSESSKMSAFVSVIRSLFRLFFFLKTFRIVLESINTHKAIS